jgi:precorrin-6B C5,15-methyltransferase / cobalt-precorrin-6B C5,C15-methyltransferase
MTGAVAVIGIDGRPLSDEAAGRLASATLVVGAARHLEQPGIPEAAKRIVLGDVSTGLAALSGHGGDAVVLASGDPGFFGIIRLLAENHLPCEVFPAASSVAMLCARAGVPWDDALVMSAHGRGPDGLRRAVNACRAFPKVAVLTAPGSGPAELGAGLAGHRRQLLVGENLGTADEIVTTCRPEDAARRTWADPNVVLVHAEAPNPRSWSNPGRQVPLGWALDDDSFEHRNSMVTKSEVRALVLARLGPGVGDLIWDIGCGSGSVAIECARFGAAVSAVDADPAQTERTTRNADAVQVPVHVVTGEAPAILDGLADPDAVFIGGGGAGVGAIIDTAAAREPRVIVTALASVERVGTVVSALRSKGYRPDGVQLSAARLAPLPDETSRLAAQNPVFVLWGER